MSRDAASKDVIRLRPDGPPSKLEGVSAEAEFAGPPGVAAGTLMLRNVSDPTITVFRPAKPNGIGAIVCPGGGWRILAWQHEGLDVARWLAERGYTAFLLKYRVMGTPAAPAEFEAAMAAMNTQIALPRSGRDAPRALSDFVPAAFVQRPREIAADDGRRAIALVRERAQEWRRSRQDRYDRFFGR